MPRIGTFVLDIFGKEKLEQARNKKDFFSSWGEILNAAGLPEKVAAHSRIHALRADLLLIETDHTGWLQILQTNKKNLLEIINSRFSDIKVTEIGFIVN